MFSHSFLSICKNDANKEKIHLLNVFFCWLSIFSDKSLIFILFTYLCVCTMHVSSWWHQLSNFKTRIRLSSSIFRRKSVKELIWYETIFYLDQMNSNHNSQVYTYNVFKFILNYYQHINDADVKSKNTKMNLSQKCLILVGDQLFFVAYIICSIWWLLPVTHSIRTVVEIILFGNRTPCTSHRLFKPSAACVFLNFWSKFCFHYLLEVK